MTHSEPAAMRILGGEPVVLEEVRAEASINDLMAEVTVTQRYRNPGEDNIEAVYTFPLPLEGVLLGFEAEIGDRKLAGAVMKRAKAEHNYEEAIADGDGAALLEQSGPGLYTASVGNLLPGEIAAIRFRYGLLLRWNDDRVRFAMPTTIAPRYGDPAAAGLEPYQEPEYVLDAGRSFALRVAVSGLLKDARLNSPSHDVAVASEAGATIVTLDGEPAMDRDFVLEARLEKARSAGAMAGPDRKGWLALASFRPEIPEDDERQPRAVKIVVDCSGSMGGDSIAQARTALERILDGLRAEDFFDIVAFGSAHCALFGRETRVSGTSLAEARRFVRDLDSNMGGTEIAAALEAACRLRGAPVPDRDLLLITDGEVWDDASSLDRARRSGHRFFTVGVGHAVAEAFLLRLAEATGGACELVGPNEDMAGRIHRHFQRMYAPRAQRAMVHWPRRTRRELPASIETAHGGDTLHLFAWFAEKPEGNVKLDITLADDRIVTQEVPIVAAGENPEEMPSSRDSELSALARIGAARRLDMPMKEKKAAKLAERYQLLSRWTSCVIIHVRADGEKAGTSPKLAKVPQTLAASWHGTSMTVQFDSRKAPASIEPKSTSFIEVFENRFDDMAYSPRFSESFFDTMDPAKLVESLNAHSVSSSPTLDELESWGVPEETLEMLRNLVDRGAIEAAVVAAFLYLLAGSNIGDPLDRRTRRWILDFHKKTPPGPGVMKAVTEVFDDWRGYMAA